MKLQIHEKSLFAILWRSPWWVSALIAMALVAVGRFLLPEAHAVYAIFVALPFALIALLAALKQLRQPGAGRVAADLEALRAMSWEDFSAAAEDAFRRDGYVVTRLADARADFELAKAGHIALVGAKRWKAARTGVEPLRELRAAARARAAHSCIYLAAGEVSDNARAFAAENGVRLVHDAELARLVARAPRPSNEPTTRRRA